MPPLPRRATIGWPATVVLLGALTLILWLCAGSIVTVGVVTVFVAVTLAGQAETRRLRVDRANDTRKAFVDHFAARGISPVVAREVHGRLCEWAGFPVRPDDDLFDTLRMDPMDLDDLLVESALACGCREPATADFSGLPPLRTVDDLVRTVRHLVGVAPRS